MGPRDHEAPLLSRHSNSSPSTALTPVRWQNPLPSPSLSLGSLPSPNLSTPSPWSDNPSRPLASEPDGVVEHPVQTPPTDGPMDLDMHLLAGGALHPAPSTGPPSRVDSSRPGAGLRLPSFESLGIACPHPSQFKPGTPSAATPRVMTRWPAYSRYAGIDLGGLGLGERPSLERRLSPHPAHAILPPIQRDIAALTPPADSGDSVWNPMRALSLSDMDSRSSDARAQSPGVREERGLASAAASEARPTSDPTPSPARPLWIHDALLVLLENMQSSSLPNNSLRILSHALPSPSSVGHVYSDIISAMHESTPSNPTVWINVFHAIPGKFNLADLPGSPPTTPGSPISGDDYFTQKVFDSAVPISDYQEDLSSLPRSPRPVVPPSSINVSIVERYIPPTSIHEFEDMFNPNGASILVDRLVELSPDNGSLVFIYPNRAGARRFMHDYLAPILDPILRSLVVVHGLSSDMSRTVGKMVAADQLPDHAQLEQSMRSLCSKLTQRRGVGTAVLRRFHGARPAFSLVHASQQQVVVSRDVWARDWWTKQEKVRIRDTVTQFARDAQRRPSIEHSDPVPGPTELMAQLTESVVKKPYPPGQEPTAGIEVSVFVIQRSA